MTKDKYIFGKRTSRKQIVNYCYTYKGHNIIYRFSFPVKEGAEKSYYTNLVDKEVKKLEQSGALEKHAKSYIRKMKWLVDRKGITIGVAITAGLAVIATVGVLTTYFVYFHPDSVTLNSETLTLNKNNVRLHQDADITFAVKDFYADYGYSAPVKMDKVVVNDVTLTPEQYNYSDNHLRIGAEYMTGKVYIAAEADYVHFENDTWDNIIAYANRGLRDTYIRYGRKTVVGAEHDIQIGSETKKVRVIGEGHDRLANPLTTGTKAATLTFELIDPIAPSQYGDGDGSKPYSESILKDYCADFLASSIPPQIANQIRLVSKTTAIPSGETETDDYKLFPLSLREIGEAGCEQYDYYNSYVYEESCYQYYADPYDDSLLAKHQRNESYWLRTPAMRSYAYYFDNEIGEIGGDSQATEHNVVVAFAIGETESFITDSWENVCEQANMGYDNLKDYYGVDSFLGLERQVILNSDSTHPATLARVRVIGEQHDCLAAGADLVSALTFEFVDSPASAVYATGNETKTYSGSLLENYMNDSIFKRIPLELKGNIQKVVKKTVVADFNEETESSYEESEGYLFPLSLKESGDVFYSLAQPYNAEEKSYDLFRLEINPNDPDDVAAGLKAIDRLRNHGVEYWLRSIPVTNEVNVAIQDGSIMDEMYESYKKGVSKGSNCFPVFNIGYGKKEISFEEDDLENICYYLERGGVESLKEIYHLRSLLGQQHEMLLKDGTRAYVHIIGENEDKTVDGEDTMLTFEFTSLFPDCGYVETGNTYVSWSDSYVRKYCNEYVYSVLPDCIQGLVKEVVKKSVIDLGGDNFGIETTNDKVFILSVNEIMFNEDYESIGHPEAEAKWFREENPHYSYYLGSKSPIVRAKVQTKYRPWEEEKYHKEYGKYWLRSPALKRYSSYFFEQHICFGEIGSEINSYNDVGVAPAFAI